MKVKLTLVAYIILSVTGFSQCFDTNFAFKEGETITYEVYYNWHFVWLNAGYAEFNVASGRYNSRNIFHLNAVGKTYPSYDWVFKVRDHYQSYVDKETLKPIWFHRMNYEGGYEVDDRYYFSQEENIVYTFTKNSRRPFRKDTLHIPSCTWDLISVIYFARNINYSGLHPGDSIPVTTIIDNEIFNLYIRYLGKDTIETRAGEKYRCLKFSALLVEGTIFKGGEDMVVWVTEDQNRIPVLIEAKIRVGSVKVYLSNMNGLRHPMTSLVN